MLVTIITRGIPSNHGRGGGAQYRLARTVCMPRSPSLEDGVCIKISAIRQLLEYSKTYLVGHYACCTNLHARGNQTSTFSNACGTVDLRALTTEPRISIATVRLLIISLKTAPSALEDKGGARARRALC